jgi:FkbH-like protein
MYETEANTKVESADQIPPEALAAFAGLQDRVLLRTTLPWSEHCTECVWPTCYSTCDLYSPREDGRCRRFVDGMVRIDCPDAFNHYLLKIRFKQWGKLWTPGNLRLRPIHKAENLEKRDRQVGTILYQLPLPAQIRKTLTDKRYSFKKRMALRPGPVEELPTSFLLECFNPHPQPIKISLTMRSFDKKAATIPFQRLIDLKPGFQTVRIPFPDISAVLDIGSPFSIDLIPNEVGQEITLYFGLMDFVQEVPPVRAEGKPVKCLVWDLDNTLWDGTLVEDSLENVRLKPDVVGIIEELDRRGILHSIASKNNHEDVMRALKRFQIEELFLCPQISWGPKGEALSVIAAQLNIGQDTLLFVDDSEFELQQVKAACPEVRVLNAKDCGSILDMKACQLPLTAESVNRRQMYRVEHVRQDIAQNFKDDYQAFLRHCEIRLTIRPLTKENLERVHELTQRTNQMNFSGNRYEREVLKKILQISFLDTYVLSCEDRFGSYGVVGFGIVDNREPRMTDLMFSCRIQSKRVEHAFLGFLLRKYIATNGGDFHANYRKTSRNLPSGQVFVDFGMQEVDVRDGVTELVFSKDRKVPDDGIVRIIGPEIHLVLEHEASV